MSLSRAIKHSDIHLEVLSLQSRKSFEYLLCYHRMVVISPKDLEGFKADIVFIYMMLACWLSIWTLIWLLQREISLVRALSDVRFDWLVGKMIV